MRRALVAGCVLVLASGVAGAGGNTRQVDVTSEPEGATVYLNDVDSGTVCIETPCKINAPVGQSITVILQKDGYTPDFVSYTAAKRGKLKPIKSVLTAAIGTIVLTDAGFKGGKILVDDVEKGNAPQKVDVPAGPHRVVVVIKGRAVADDIVDVEANSEKEVHGTTPTTVAEPTGGGGGGGGGSEDLGVDVGSEPVKVVKEPEPSGPRRRWIEVGGDLDVGFRQFTYDHAQNLSATETEAGQAMAGPSLELWPIELAGGTHLRGLSLFGKVLFGLNHQPVLDADGMASGTTTFWGNIEADLRYRWIVGEDSSVAIEGGFVRDQLDFSAPNATLKKQVPGADYRSIKLGVRAATTLGALEPFAALEGRIVQSGGALATNFASGADITGAHATVGATVHAGPVFLRAQAAITYYGWTFTAKGTPGPMDPTAEGATDLVEVLSFVIGLAH
ncbi:MAG: PEGA domain-containing protein [Kofleriaceae bacterium]